MKDKICPLLAVGLMAGYAGPDWDINRDRYCMEDTCAMWDEQRGCCGLIAKDINVPSKREEKNDSD